MGVVKLLVFSTCPCGKVLSKIYYFNKRKLQQTQGNLMKGYLKFGSLCTVVHFSI